MVDRYRNYQPYQPRPRKKSHRGFFLLCFVACVVVGIFIKHNLARDEKKTPATTTTTRKKTVKAEPISTDTWNRLEQNVTALINNHPELDISVSVIDASTNTRGSYGIQDNFAGASTTKVLTAVYFLHQVEKGKESLSEVIDGQSAKWQLRQMINQSNNDSWSALNNELGYQAMENYAHSIGLGSYQWENNLMTADDEATLLQKVYSGQLLNASNRSLLLSYMQHTNDEDMIPKVTPSAATVYHKYGQLDDRLHDAAIIDYQNRPIVLVIYTKGEANTNGSEYTTRVQLIQQLASTVFQIIYT